MTQACKLCEIQAAASMQSCRLLPYLSTSCDLALVALVVDMFCFFGDENLQSSLQFQLL